MSVFASPCFLRYVLLADAVSCAACGALQVAATEPVAQLLALPSALLLETGLFLLVYAAVVAFVGTRTPVPRTIVGLCIVGNLGWALACVLLLASGTLHPSAWGTAYVVMQAVTVVLLAELQWLGLRQAQPERILNNERKMA